MFQCGQLRGVPDEEKRERIANAGRGGRIRETSSVKPKRKVTLPRSRYVKSRTRSVVRRKGDFQQCQLWLDPRTSCTCNLTYSRQRSGLWRKFPAVLPEDHPLASPSIWDMHRPVEHQGSFGTWLRMHERFYVSQGRRYWQALSKVTLPSLPLQD